MRIGEKKRKTKETEIEVVLSLDGTGKAEVTTGVGFFDHMLEAFAVHSGCDLKVQARGDLDVDSHHTVEDVGIVLGQAFLEAVGEKKGIARYGTAFVPMDEALARCVLDISGRPFLRFFAEFEFSNIGNFDTQLVEEFFQAFAFNAKVTLHLDLLRGNNDHHKCEAIFKSFAHAVKQAVSLTGGQGILSSKGSL